MAKVAKAPKINGHAAADSAFADEDELIFIDVLANDGGGATAQSLYSVNQNSAGAAALTTISRLGGLVAIENGQIRYQAVGAAIDALAEGETVEDTFTYVMQLGNGVRSVATVTVTLTGTNDAPVVTGVVTGAATEDGAAVTLNALANARDIDRGTVLSVTDLEPLPAGVRFDAATQAFTLDAGNSAFQALAAGATHTVTVSYKISDGMAATAAQASWTVSGTNDAPVVTGAVSGTATEDGTAVTLEALANTSDVDSGAALAITDMGGLPAGITYDAVTKSFTLDPTNPAFQDLARDATRIVTVNYMVSDGTAAVNASVSWTVTGTNDAPVVTGAASGAAAEDGATVTVNALANASDIDAGAVLDVIDVATLPDGVAYDAATRSFTLDPRHASFQSLAAGATRDVIIDYKVSDGMAAPIDARAVITVTGTNDVPVAQPLFITLGENEVVLLTLPVSDPDAGDTLELTSIVAYGAVQNASIVDGQIRIEGTLDTLAEGQLAAGGVRYTVRDSQGAVASSDVLVTLRGENDAPVVSGAVTAAATEDGATVTINALANATDVDNGAVLGVVNVGALPDGVTYDAATKSFTLDPSHASFQSLAAGATREVAIDYKVTDGLASPVDARAVVTITGTNDNPTAQLLFITLGEDEVVFIDPPVSDPDVGDTFELTSVVPYSAVQRASIVDGQIRIEGTLDFLAEGQLAAGGVRYTIRDSQGAVASRDVLVTVRGENDAPVVSGAVIGSATEDGASVTLSALARASDVDSGAVLSVIAPAVLPGGVSYDAGTRSFTLDSKHASFQHLAAGATENVTVNYKVSDGIAAPVDAQALFTVTGTNDAPTAAAIGAQSVNENQRFSLALSATALDPDDGAVLRFLPGPGNPPGVAIQNGVLIYDQGTRYDALRDGQTAVASLSYIVADQNNAMTTITLALEIRGRNDEPEISGPVVGSTTEGGSAVTIHALGNATDAEGDALSVLFNPAFLPAGVTYDAAAGTFTLDPKNAAYEDLAAGATERVNIHYRVTDGIGIPVNAQGIFFVNGTNDAPVVTGPVIGAATEDGAAVTLSALANASDIDLSTVLFVVGINPLPAGVTYNATAKSFTLDPTHAVFDSLVEGETREVFIDYKVTDGLAANVDARAVWTVTGVDAPVDNIFG